jgi:hypothetical protein
MHWMDPESGVFEKVGGPFLYGVNKASRESNGSDQSVVIPEGFVTKTHLCTLMGDTFRKEVPITETSTPILYTYVRHDTVETVHRTL